MNGAGGCSFLILAKPACATPLDVTTPGDIMKGVPNNGNWPVNEAPALAIDDNTGTKYLHFNGDFEPDLGPTGFRVTPSDSQNVVTGLTFTTANDYPGRDPIAFELYGSNISIDGPYTLIFSGEVIDFRQRQVWPRLTMNETPISFDNDAFEIATFKERSSYCLSSKIASCLLVSKSTKSFSFSMITAFPVQIVTSTGTTQPNNLW